MTAIALHGCRATPLMSYLQALGVLRVLHEQRAPELASYWHGSTLHIDSDLTQEAIIRFFVDDYEPTPMLSPWNGGGGFRTLKHEKGEQAVARIESSDDPRLAAFRNAIVAARRVRDWGLRDGWLEDKTTFLAACRSAFPDEALDWLDASVVLTDARKPQYPLLLGTGGNLGRLDLTTTYMEALSVLLDPEQTNRAEDLLAHALFRDGHPELDTKKVGQYFPAAAGTINSSAFDSAASVTNLWSIAFYMEGALLFASGVARRFSGSQGLATTPFTVSGHPAGYSAAEGERVKGEFWAPLWKRPMTVPELRRVIAEGRVSWRGKQAAHGLDAAKALSTLGVDRGLSRFERYVIADRFGRSPLAAPAGSFAVTPQPADHVSLLGATDTWLAIVRRQDLPNAAASALRRVDAAQMDVAQSPNSRTHLQDFLVELASLEWVISRNPKLAAATRPVPRLDRRRWGPQLDDGSPEWRLAAALATQHDTDGRSASVLFRPVRLSEKSRKRLEWAKKPTGSPSGSVTDRLEAALIERTILCADRTPDPGVPTVGSGGMVAFDYAEKVRAVDVLDFLNRRRVDDRRLNRLLSAAALLDGWPRIKWPETDRRVVPNPAHAVLAAFYHPKPLATPPTDEHPEGRKAPLLVPGRSWPQKLRAGRTADVVREALVRLRQAGFDPAVRAEMVRVPSPNRLLASLLIPTYVGDVQHAINTICPPTKGE